MRSDKAGKFTKRDAQRIANCVASFERGKRKQKGIKYQRNYAGGGSPVRLGKTTAAWSKGTLATIRLYEEGTPPNETAASPEETLEGCVNHFADVDADRWVVVAKGVTGAWYLAEYERSGDDGSCRSPNVGGDDLTKLEGYNAGATQILGHVNGCLKWIDTTDCQ
jgi:hypothetical protein